VTTASTPKGERRRQALVAAAGELLMEGGFDAVRHRAVAERAGLPLASTTYYFQSLDELIVTALEHEGRVEIEEARERLDTLASAELDTDAVVELFLDLLLGEESRRGGLDAVLPRYERFVATGRRPYLAPLMRRLRVELDTLLMEILARIGVRASRERVFQLVAVVDGAVVSALIESDPDPRGVARRTLLSLAPELS
jgi:DNA-binding transcriptional regulator YbjK